MLQCFACGHTADDSDFPEITEEEIFADADAFDNPADMEEALAQVGCKQCPECGSMAVLDEEGN